MVHTACRSASQMAPFWLPYGTIWLPYGLHTAHTQPPYVKLMAPLWPPYGAISSLFLPSASNREPNGSRKPSTSHMVHTAPIWLPHGASGFYTLHTAPIWHHPPPIWHSMADTWAHGSHMAPIRRTPLPYGKHTAPIWHMWLP
jgi:hypothetical protein